MNGHDVDVHAIVDGAMARDRNDRTRSGGAAATHRGQLVRSGAGPHRDAPSLEGPRLEITATPGVPTDPRSIVDAAQDVTKGTQSVKRRRE